MLFVGFFAAMLDPLKLVAASVVAWFVIAQTKTFEMRMLFLAFAAVCLGYIAFVVAQAVRMSSEAAFLQMPAMLAWFAFAVWIFWRRQNRVDRERKQDPQFSADELQRIETAKQPWLPKGEREDA